MKENTLLKVALVCSIVGLAALYIVSLKVQIPEYAPSNLNLEIGKDVVLKGTISKISDNGNEAFINIKTEHDVDVVVFLKESLSLDEGNHVEITGTVQEYNGKEEIIAEKIRVEDVP